MKKFKIFGLILALIYFVLTFLDWIYYVNCKPLLCYIGIMFDTLPWSTIYDPGRYGFGLTINLGYIILNSIIIYYVVYLLARFYNYHKIKY